MDAVIVRVIDLPYAVDGVTVKDEEGDFNIYLNARLSADKQANAFRHEVNHIKMGHFYNFVDIGTKEQEVKSANH